ncbi:MAG: phosphoribosylanthranilate isomerase [Candidatus Eisenbacteria bacterium]
MAHTVVKICGITRLEDASLALSAGADWLGFILKGDSPRLVTAANARRVLADLGGTAVTVAVMVEPTPEEALLLATAAGAARVQLHGVDPARWPADFPLPAAFAVPVAEDGALQALLPPRRDLVLLDTASALRAGGTGRTFPWFVAATVAADFDVMVAGGLDADNVRGMLEEVGPFGVDASSRLESLPGIKDAGKVSRFVAAVRSYDEAGRG